MGDTKGSKDKSGEGFVLKDSPAPRPDGVDFATFLLSLGMSARIHMGSVPDPLSGKTEQNLEIARQNIDLLLVLRDKTRGNLNPDEAAMMERLLADVQMEFVKISKSR